MCVVSVFALPFKNKNYRGLVSQLMPVSNMKRVPVLRSAYSYVSKTNRLARLSLGTLT